MMLKLTQVSISPTIYKQLLRQFPFIKKLHTQTISTEKLLKELLYEKAARKLLVKLTLTASPNTKKFLSTHKNQTFSVFLLRDFYSSQGALLRLAV